ncbi:MULTISPECIES: flagellar hook protein FlgE [unclassified Thioalkalivibrio]|uniref:flagellar hook protein FlgE n=1 Tax=unclassified Thioalkalivibrio TaxID=2621013 RepID=UPI00035FE3A2|nr:MULTISPECIES: flagellar hook protein FlgE [unclassified Thioalkalivibrio]
MPFNIGLSGLNSAQADLQTTGNNVSNAGTTGFKRSRAEFGDVFAQSFGGVSQTATGGGSRLMAVTQQFSQGRTEFTENGLDLAIDGEGFFVMNDGGNRVYTRAGEFQVNREGNLVNNQGQQLQGYPPINPGSTDTDFNTGQLGDLRLQTGASAPQATSEIEALVNLQSGAVPPEEAFDFDDPDTYNYSTSLTVYDSLGTSRDARLYFVKSEDGREWDAHIRVNDGVDSDGNTTYFEGGPFELDFDPNGQLSSDSDFNFTTGDFENGAAALDIDIDFTGTTQFGGDFAVNDLGQDGFASGRLTGVDIDSSGVVFARFTNGQSSVLGQVALANFTNPQGLEQLGNNNWAETFAAGDPVFASPGTGNLGQIQAGALEASNVDIAQELVNLITAQRNFQANAQTISTADQVTQTIINIR